MGTASSAPIARPEITGTRVVATALGICVGVSGLDHGLFEALQGATATPGFFVQAIGPDQRMWLYGTEDAFTLIPDFLATGILAMVVGLLTIIWSIRFIDRPDGSRVFLGLGGLLFLVGGGVAMLVLVLFGWAVARHIQRPPRWARSIPPGMGRILSRAWPLLVAVGLVLYAFAMEVAVVGFVPAVSDPDLARVVCWAALFAMLATFLGAFVGASAGVAADASGQVAHSTPRAQPG